MKQQLVLTLFCISCLLVACSKNKPDNTQPEQPGGQVKLPHGMPVGEIASAQIGPAGGTLTGKDGTMKITVPAGAVTEPVTFSVQEVENVLENGAHSYRLLPDNVSFKKPVTLTYCYGGHDLGHTHPDFLFLTYQDKDGYFFSANRTVGDRQQQTLSVNTTHFSDWTFYAEYEFRFPDDQQLVNGELRLGQGEEARIVLLSRPVDKKVDTSELPEVRRDPVIHAAIWDYAPKLGTMTKITEWLPGVVYKAPAKVEQEARTYINATINGNLGTDNLGKTVQQIQMRLPIVLEPDGYFYLTEDGVVQPGSSLSATYLEGMGCQIGATFFNGHTILCHTYNGGAGSFPYGSPGQGVVGLIEMVEMGDPTKSLSYMSYRPKNCDQAEGVLHSPGSLVLKSVPQKVGDYFEGEFTVTLYFYSYCRQATSKNLSGRFRIRNNG